jgi:hypothetical protein
MDQSQRTLRTSMIEKLAEAMRNEKGQCTEVSTVKE